MHVAIIFTFRKVVLLIFFLKNDRIWSLKKLETIVIGLVHKNTHRPFIYFSNC